MGLGVTVIGAGGWGTALAVTISRKGIPVVLWARAEDEPGILADSRENKRFLPGVKFPAGMTVTPDLALASTRKCAAIVLAVPSHGIRQVAGEMGGWRKATGTIISATKGFEVPSALRPSEVIAEALGAKPGEICVLSGPSHAEEVARDIPTAIVAACPDIETARRVQELIFTPRFRVYTLNDQTGVELGGALKNIIAIACGISDGLGFGDNTKAALITRGLAEMARLGTALGGRAETFRGLAGLGDLVVTCTSPLSRNRNFGLRIGQGEDPAAVASGMAQVAEGVRASQAAMTLSERVRVSMPIAEQVFAILHGGRKPGQALRDLLAREARPEEDASEGEERGKAQ